MCKSTGPWQRNMLLHAMESTIFTCGMAPLDQDGPCHDVYHCDPSLDRDTHIESEFYTSKIKPGRIDICCHSASTNESPVRLNTSLKALEGPYSNVLPICEECMDMGRHVIVRAAIQNAEAKKPGRLRRQQERLVVRRSTLRQLLHWMSTSGAGAFAPIQPKKTRNQAQGKC
jgi:hypothetical protein